MIKSFFMVIVFIVGGQETIQDGWYPMEVDSYERCERGVNNIKQGFIDQRDTLPPSIDSIRVFCMTVLTPAKET